MAISGDKYSLPKQLMNIVLETMEETIPVLYKQVGGEKVKEIFKKHILKAPCNDDVLNSVDISKDSVLGKQLIYLHRLYNDPDSSRVSEVANKPDALVHFRDTMVQQYKMAKRMSEKLAAIVIPHDPAPPVAPVDLVKFDPPAKRKERDTIDDVDGKEPPAKFLRIVEDSDEDFARKLQEELDRETESEKKKVKVSADHGIKAMPARPVRLPSPAVASCKVEDSDEDFARKLQEEIDREVEPLKREVKARSRKPGESISIINGVVYRNGKRDDDVSLADERGNIVINQIIDDGSFQFGGKSFGPVAMHSSVSPFSMYSPSSPRPQAAEKDGQYNLRMSEKLTLPDESKGCKINGGMSCNITLGKQCSDITIKAGMSNNVTLGQGCRTISISTGMSCNITLGDDCRDVTIKLGMSARYTLGNNCKDIYVNGRKVV